MGSNREGTDCSLTVRRKQVAQNLLSRRKSTWGKEREKSSRNKGSVRVLKCKGRMRVRKTEMSTRKGDRSVFAVLLKYMSSITMLKRFSSLHTGIRFSWGTCLMTQRKQTSESEWHQLTFAFVDRVQSNNKTVHCNVDVPKSAAADTRRWLGPPLARTSQPSRIVVGIWGVFYLVTLVCPGLFPEKSAQTYEALRNQMQQAKSVKVDVLSRNLCASLGTSNSRPAAFAFAVIDSHYFLQKWTPASQIAFLVLKNHHRMTLSSILIVGFSRR